MRVLKACAIAFSMYSQIPMPQFAWKEEDMKYVLCFFPWIGIVIGVCQMLWWECTKRCSVGSTAYVLIGAAIPLLITGGFHVDGFMDTMDALHSYQSRERKLEILKDSHIGAFSVISLLVYYLLYIAAFSEIHKKSTLLVVGLGFVLSRVLSALGIFLLAPAKKDGTLRTFRDQAEQKRTLVVLVVELLLCAAILLVSSPLCGGSALLGAGAVFFYYRFRSRKEFGGITGDTAGWFLLLCELIIVVMAVIGERLPDIFCRIGML